MGFPYLKPSYILLPALSVSCSKNDKLPPFLVLEQSCFRRALFSSNFLYFPVVVLVLFIERKLVQAIFLTGEINVHHFSGDAPEAFHDLSFPSFGLILKSDGHCWLREPLRYVAFNIFINDWGHRLSEWMLPFEISWLYFIGL